MPASELYPDLCTQSALPKNELLEVHTSKISLHHAKGGYDYPTIWLPHTFSRLVGLSTRIYQTVQEGALAFLVVICPRTNTSESPKSSAFTRRRSPVQIRPIPSYFYQSATLEPSIEVRVARIVTRNKHNKDKKLHNSDEKLPNSDEPDLTWQEMTDLSPEDDVAGCRSAYYAAGEQHSTQDA